MRDLYHQQLLEHYRNSPFKKDVVAAQIVTELYNPSCGDRIAYKLRVNGAGVIEDIGFDASGCVLSVAAASLLAEYLCGKPLVFVQTVAAEDMQRLVGMSVGPVRLRCILLPLEALQKGVAEYEQEQL